MEPAGSPHQPAESPDGTPVDVTDAAVGCADAREERLDRDIGSATMSGIDDAAASASTIAEVSAVRSGSRFPYWGLLGISTTRPRYFGAQATQPRCPHWSAVSTIFSPTTTSSSQPGHHPSCWAMTYPDPPLGRPETAKGRASWWRPVQAVEAAGRRDFTVRAAHGQSISAAECRSQRVRHGRRLRLGPLPGDVVLREHRRELPLDRRGPTPCGSDRPSRAAHRTTSRGVQPPGPKDPSSTTGYRTRRPRVSELHITLTNTS